MICQKCNHILKGSESYCPDCGSPCVKEKEVYKEPEAPSVIFSSERDVSSNIFVDEAPPKYRREQTERTEKKKSRAGLYLVIVLCAVLAGAVAVAGSELPVVSAAIASLFSASAPEETAEPTTAVTDYNPDSGVVTPQVSYRTTVAYVTGEKGQALRKGPDSSYGQTDVLPSGTDVHIVGGASVDGSWVYIYVPEKDTYGWIDDAFLSSVTADVSVQDDGDSTVQSKE